MAKAILTWDLDDPENIKSHLRAVKATSLACALFDIEQLLRNARKKGSKDTGLIDSIQEIISEIRLDELID